MRNTLKVVVGIVFALPFWFMLVASLAPEGRALEASASGLVPTIPPAFANYAQAAERMGDFGRLVANTALVTGLAIVGQLFCCSLAGYAFARLHFPGRDLLFVLVLATMMIPEQVAAVPRFLLFQTLGLVDTFAPLILPTFLGGAPFFVFLFRQYFLSLPVELDDAARIDGCGPFDAYWRIFLPLARPMLVTVGLLTFLATWNDFWAPLIYLLSPENQTLTLALAGFQRTYNTAVEHLMAAASIVLAPCVLLYFAAQRLLFSGLRTAASKH